MKDSLNMKKSQYSSRIMVAPAMSSNKQSNSKVNYKRGVSSDAYRETNNPDRNASVDNEAMNVNGLITQVAKNARPVTSSNNYLGNASSNNLGGSVK